MSKQSTQEPFTDANYLSLIKQNITPLDLFILSKINEGHTLNEIINLASKEFTIDKAEQTIKKRWNKLLSDHEPEENIILHPHPQYIINPAKLYSSISLILIKANLELSDNITVDVSVENIFETLIALNNKPCFGKPIKQLFTITGWTYDYVGIVYENNLERFHSFRTHLLEEGIATTVDVIPIDSKQGLLFNPVETPDATQYKQFLVNYHDRMNHMLKELTKKEITATKTMRFFDKDTYILKVTAGKQKGEIYPVEKTELKIGRFYDNDIILQDVVVSRRHAKIIQRGNQYIFKDQSTNGSAVNDTKLVFDEVTLKDGDVICIGKHRFTFQKAGHKKVKS